MSISGPHMGRFHNKHFTKETDPSKELEHRRLHRQQPPHKFNHMKRILFAFCFIMLLSSCESNSVFYPDPFIFEIGTPKDSVINFVKEKGPLSPKRNPLTMENQKGGTIRINNIFNRESSNRWALYSMYVYFDKNDNVSDVMIIDVYDQACVLCIEIWNENLFPVKDYKQEKDGFKKRLAPRWCVSHNEDGEYLMSYVKSGSDLKGHMFADYAFVKTHARLDRHKQSKEDDYFGIPLQRAGDELTAHLP